MRRLAGILVSLVALAALAGGSSRAATHSPIRLPDLHLVVPTDLISIGLDGNGHRELRFTHITANLGPGLFELDPHYNAKTGVSTFSQALHRRNGSIAKRVPLATYGTWEPPSDYRYPLSSFTLNEVGPGNKVGAVVARSPKVDYCMTGDVQVPGYPNPPATTFISPSNCEDPTQPLGWSAGWGDQYDQTDAGQPISLVGVPDGTYILRATVDPGARSPRGHDRERRDRHDAADRRQRGDHRLAEDDEGSAAARATHGRREPPDGDGDAALGKDSQLGPVHPRRTAGRQARRRRRPTRTRLRRAPESTS